MRYISFLRGINVGGHQVKMDRLRELLTELGLENVRTYIQTGNVFFESGKTQQVLRREIEEHLAKALGYAVPTFVRTVGEFENALSKARFMDYELTSDTRHLILLTSKPIAAGTKLPWMSPKGDYEVIGSTKGEVFVVVHLINGKWGGANAVEKEFGVSTTGRFFHTAQKILEAAKA